MWETRWIKTARELQESNSIETLDTFLTLDKEFYPNVTTILNILAVIPATTHTCERPISALRRLKTWLRSTMTNERLTWLALTHVHRHMNFNGDKIIDNFA